VFFTRTVYPGLLTLFLLQLSLESQISKQPTLAITGVTVIEVEAGRELEHQTVILVDNRIATIGDSSARPIPAGARQIDGRGKFIIPGLIDSHVHLGNAADRDQLRALGPLLAHGVTGIRDAGAGGQDAWLVELRDRVARGELLAPRMYVSGMIAGRTVARSGLASAAALARQRVDLGIDGLKIRDGLTNDDVRAVMEVGVAAKRSVYGHTYDAVTRDRNEIYTLDAIRMGASGTMHIMGIDPRDKRPPPPPRAARWRLAGMVGLSCGVVA
jgi:hypothetical protein